VTDQQRQVFGHPTNARGLITDTEDRWLLVRPRHGRPGWRFPGGGGLPGESPSGTCSRELFEELGITVTPSGLLVTTFTVPRSPAQQGRGRINFLFECGTYRPGELRIKLQRREIASAEWIPQTEALPLLHPGNRHMIDLALDGRHYGEYHSTPLTAAVPAAGRLRRAVATPRSQFG
jgi:8-oxo-dGTP pyrophosphatase MutT (NUDIX family)